MTSYSQCVQFLESLNIMPKEMPGITKLTKALEETSWFSLIDPKKVIVVAGTNGKGTTCAILESLLISAKQNVGFYSSPHLIETTERIRCQQKNISEEKFLKLFKKNSTLIQKYDLTHFEALTLMCGDYFFSPEWENNLDYAIFEVGLGGLFDATNAIPHAYSVITALGLDHTKILGSDLLSIAKNKFGIVHKDNVVIHHQLPTDLEKLKNQVLKETNSKWQSAEPYSFTIHGEAQYNLRSKWGFAELNLSGARAAENAATALTVFETLGFNPQEHLQALQKVQWPGRMQLVSWPGLQAKLYLSGDHNEQGIQSLIEIMKSFSYENLYCIVGIGQDKDSEKMLKDLTTLKNLHLCLTETPFKGLRINEYPNEFLQACWKKNTNSIELINEVSTVATKKDLVLVTGSLYLVGAVLKYLKGLNGYDIRT